MAILPKLGARTISTPPTRTALARHASQASPFSASSARRSYASQASQQSKSSEIPWMVGSIVITVPALFYLLKSGPAETLHELKPHRSITNEIERHEQEKGIQDSRKSEKPSERDPPKAIRPPTDPGKNSGAQSAKQQGLTNTETKHPSLETPGKSVKAEGETETAKVMGTVSPERDMTKSS
ncbi:uncharacterized protein TRUGW13939_05440 [Talaromyces rugulosus]|uniref:Uncharacterized protein n=1 Tax=Talaromyces rugulosus TaxID=121627 RepID=A0A7H8QXF4_TALRU|nr:uncharacterized protein TRUGW13939_05440 [Talaromyces rugulosus]QKX58318.1 hypothetical protein TRUGW13939_05440 [Talaromyces rugulosus]